LKLLLAQVLVSWNLDSDRRGAAFTYRKSEKRPRDQGRKGHEQTDNQDE